MLVELTLKHEEIKLIDNEEVTCIVKKKQNYYLTK